MKVQILSDLHNEFHRARNVRVPDIEDAGADLIILAGDIDVGLAGVHWAIEQSERLHRPLVYVCGNHEFYGECPKELLTSMRAVAQGTRVHVLENEAVGVDGVRVLGATLWTDFRALGRYRENECMRAAVLNIADFRLIRFHNPDGTHTHLQPINAASWHATSLTWLTQELAKPFNGRTVVVTHHGPSIQCHDYLIYGGPDPISVSFWSRIERLLTSERVTLWVYGHTHSNLRFEENGVPVVCNQRGYLEAPAIAEKFDPVFTVDV